MNGTPTQVAHSGRAVLRFIVAWAVGLGIAFLARTIGLDLTEMSGPIIDGITAGLALVISSAVQWLLTRPRVEAFLARGRARSILATGVHTEPVVIDSGHQDPLWLGDEMGG